MRQYSDDLTSCKLNLINSSSFKSGPNSHKTQRDQRSNRDSTKSDRRRPNEPKRLLPFGQMLQVFLKSKLERFWDAKRTLQKGISYIENQDQGNENLTALSNQKKGIDQKIKAIARSIKESLELEGIKSLSKRIQIRIKDRTDKSNLASVLPVIVENIEAQKPNQRETIIQISEKSKTSSERYPTKNKERNKEIALSNYQKFFKESSVFDFRNHTSEYLKLKKIDTSGVQDEFRNLGDVDKTIDSKVRFSREFEMIPHLRTLVKERRLKTWAKNRPLKSNLKFKSDSTSSQKNFKIGTPVEIKKNLKKLIKQTIESKTEVLSSDISFSFIISKYDYYTVLRVCIKH